MAQQIPELEAVYSVHLFDRANGSLRATPLCSELCDIGQRIQEAERDAHRVLDRRTGAGAHLLRVGLGNSMPGIAIIGELVKDHPSALVTVQTGSHRSILAALLRREVDVAVLPDLPPDARFRRAPVLTQEVVGIVAAQHPLACKAEVSFARLVEEPLIFRSAGSSTQKIVDRALRRAELTAHPRLVADTRDGVYEAVAMGSGSDSCGAMAHIALTRSANWTSPNCAARSKKSYLRCRTNEAHWSRCFFRLQGELA